MTDTELWTRQVLADIDAKLADRDHKRQLMKFAPWAMALSGMTAGAALFAAGAAFMKVMG